MHARHMYIEYMFTCKSLFTCTNHVRVQIAISYRFNMLVRVIMHVRVSMFLYRPYKVWLVSCIIPSNHVSCNIVLSSQLVFYTW